MASNQNDNKKRRLEYFYQLNSAMPLIRIVSVSILIIMGILVLDILNIPSRLFEKAPEQLWSVVLVGFVLIIAFWLIEHSYIQAYRLKTINSIDAILSCLFLSSLICSFYYSVSAGGFSTKACITLVSLLFSFVSIIYRAYKCKHQTKHNEYILDFSDIVNNNFSVSKDLPLLISEKEVDYDLLNRSSIIELLYSTITNYQSDRSFVIALCGEWGSGKTTIINNTKRLLKKNADSPVIIDDFDPWIYGSRDALLLSMFEKILNKTGVKYSVLKSNRIAKNLKITFGDIGKALSKTDQVSSLIQELVSPNGSFDQIAAIKTELSMYLKSLDKPVVFIIDNIDRADSDNIIFLFKLIGTLFDLPNILYILSYDSKRVNELISDTAKINPKYIEKIVQQEIHVPPVQKDRLEELYQGCLRNILQQYNVNFESDTIYSSLCKLFADKINVRNYKRLLNSAISRVYQNSHRLDNAALLAIESIKFLSPSLYDLMVNNRKYFISSDKILDDEARDNIYLRDRFNKSGKEFYSDLASEYPQYLSLLCALFPYAYRYNKGEELEVQYPYDDNYFKSKVPIYSAKFFDLYFSYGSNAFSVIIESVKNMIASINSPEKKNVRTIFEKHISEIPTDWHREWFETLQLYIDEILDSRKYALVKVIWLQLGTIDNDIEFMMLNAHQRALVIIAKLIKQLSAEEVRGFFTQLGKKYQWIYLVSELIYWIEADNKNSNSDNQWIDDLRTIYANMCNKIIKERVHLYDSAYYRYKNIYGILRFFCGEKNTVDDREICKQYIQNTFLDEYVYRLLADCITTSRRGNVYGYTIQADSDLLQFVDKIRIDEAIQQRPPQSDIEEVVLKLYREYCVTGHNIENQYNVSTPIIFKL